MAKYNDREFYNVGKRKRNEFLKLILIAGFIIFLANIYSTSVHGITIVEVVKNMLGW